MSKKTVSQDPKDQEPKSQEPKSQEPRSLELRDQEPKNQELKLQDTKKPQNLRANAMPSDGFILAVDGKLKTRYESSKDAMTAGAKLKQSYPVIQVAVYDAIARVYTPVDL